DISGRKRKARIVPLPFYPRRGKDEPSVKTSSPYDLRFTERHVWARLQEGSKDVVTLGLTDFGQRRLGDILCLELPKPGTRITKGAAAGWGDTYRSAFEIISPVSGEVVAVNKGLAERPAEINAYPYAVSGIMQVRIASPADYEALM